MTQPSTGLRVGAIGAGRVGATLSAALGRAGHEIVAVAGESDASRQRSAALLPGVPLAKPSDVARACDLLLLTVPDDMLPNVVAMLSASGAIREGQYVVHTSGRHGLAVLEPAAAVGARVIALHPAMTFTGTAMDLDRLIDCAFGVTADEALRPMAEALVLEMGGEPVWVDEADRTTYHLALAHGANHPSPSRARRWSCSHGRGSPNPGACWAPSCGLPSTTPCASGTPP
jgi:predicted short-subunit dehydrogenase-like oxidoreductase (DUF2520 family)